MHSQNIRSFDPNHFWSRVDRSGNGCWEFQGCRIKDGYGQAYFEGRKHMAHRVAWLVANGPIPDGLFVCHRCDNPPCCRPDHLFLGTGKDNAQDMKAKDRHAYGARHPVAKLNDDDVRAIRSQYPKVTQPELARRFSVSQSTIWNVLHRRKRGGWSHVGIVSGEETKA